MAQPQPYNRQYNFQNFQAADAQSPLPAHHVDAEYNAIKVTLDEVLARLVLIQRDDGGFRNASVGVAAFNASVNLGWGPPESWATATEYGIMDSVFYAGGLYRCLVDHTSSVFATDLSAEKWGLLHDFEVAEFTSAAQVPSDPVGEVSATNIQDAIEQLATQQYAEIASAATCDIGVAGVRQVLITGTETISSFGPATLAFRFLKFESALTLTHNGALQLPGGRDIKIQPNDTMLVVSDEVGAWYCVSYQPYISSAEGSIAAAGTCDIGGLDSERVTITGNTTITSFGTVPNRTVLVRFEGTPLLTYNGTSMILPGARSLTVTAGTTGVFQSDASGNWRCLSWLYADRSPTRNTETAVASAATCDIGSPLTDKIEITGTTTITSFGTVANRAVFVRLSGALLLTHNGTSLILPGGISITTAAGDTFVAISDGSGNWRVFGYQRANGQSLSVALETIASASTTNLGSVNAEQISISGTTTITSFGSSAPVGAEKSVRFEDILQLTYNGTSMILPLAANLTTAAGDMAKFRHEGSGNWRCTNYERADGLPLARATQLSAQTGTANTGAMTELRTAEAIAALAPFARMIWCRDLKSSGSDGAAISNGSYGTRELTTAVVNTITGASLSSNEIVLPAGTYYVTAYANAVNNSGAGRTVKLKLRNVTDGTDIIMGSGTGSMAGAGGGGSSAVTHLMGRFTLAAQKNVALQMRASGATVIGGVALSFGDDEIYADIVITKVA